MKNKVLITRPHEHGLRFIQSMTDISPETFIHEPVMSIHHRNVESNDESYDGIILTSQNAVRHVKAMKGWENAHYYCVGASVRQELSYLGVRADIQASKTAESLSETIGESSQNPRLLYLRGKDISFDMKSALENKGYEVTESIVYDAIEKTELTQPLINALKGKNIGAVTFFSARSAKIYMSLVTEAELLEHLDGIKVLCIRDSMLEYLNTYFDSNDIVVSESPDMEGMKELVYAHVRGSY